MKALKIFGIAVVVCVVLVVSGFLILLGIMNDRNENYWKYAETNGEIETRYTAPGTYEVSTVEWSADGKTWQKYEAWYPAELKDGNGTYPLVIMVNGTGVRASQYREVFRHLASWGFIVVGSEDENSRTGDSSAAALDFMPALNGDKSSDFYGRIDAGNVYEYTEGELTEGSAQGICPLWWLDEYYNAIPDSVDKVIARKVNADHGDMLRGADSYMTAWFMYWLKGDTEAGNAFLGENAEIFTNTSWQDVKINGHFLETAEFRLKSQRLLQNV